MNIQALRYVVQIGEIGSINKAAQQLYISQSTLSRAIQEIEETTGFIIFQRSSKGVIMTHEGKKIIGKAKKLLASIEQFENQFFYNQLREKDEVSLHLGVQYSYPALLAFIRFHEECGKEAEYLNLIYHEGRKDEIFELIRSRLLDIGIVHYLSAEEEEFKIECNNAEIVSESFFESPVCVQVRQGHPLERKKTVSLEDLDHYPRVAFLNEDVTGINYCSDVLQFDRNLLKRRIVVRDRGSQRELLFKTDGYYIGNFYDTDKLKELGFDVIMPIKCIPLENVDASIKTAIVHRKNYKYNQYGERYIEIIKDLISCF